MEKRISSKIRLVFFLAVIFLILLPFFSPERLSAAPAVNLYSKLGSAEEITSPEIGPGGTIAGLPTYEEGRDGNGIQLDDDSEWVQFPSDGTIDSNSDDYIDDQGMISFWFKPSRDMSEGIGYLFATNSKYARIMILYSTTTVKAYFRYNGGAFELESDPISWSAGDWCHFRLWWDNNDATDNVKLWLNGTSILPAHNGTFIWQYAHADWFRIGGRDDGLFSAQGLFDEIRVFDSLDSTPSIDSISDDILIPGQQITVSGSDFGLNDDDQGQVSFGGVAGTIDSWNNTEILATVPEGIGDGQVTVTTYIATSNGINYTLGFNLSGAYYAGARNMLLIQGGAFGVNQGTGKVYADGTDLGIADYWDANRIYYLNISSQPSSIRVVVDGEELTANVTNLSLYSPYPYDTDINSDDLVSYWPFDSDWADVKGTNNGTNRGTTLRPEAIFNKALQPSQLVGFENNRYVAFGGLLKLNNGDIIDIYRNTDAHVCTSDSRLEIVRSTDSGYTWSEPETILQIPGYDVGGGGVLIQLRNGDIICLYHQRTAGCEYLEPGVIASTDNGYTWSVRATLPKEGLDQLIGPYGYPIQLENGRILVSIAAEHPDYPGRNTRVVYYSDDNGHTWHYLAIVAYSPDLGDAPTTTTTQAYSAGSVEITVNDASIFPDQGLLCINDGVDEECFSYGYKEESTLKNIYDSALYPASGITNDYDSGASVWWRPVNPCETQIIKAPDDNNLLALTRHNGFGTSPGMRILYSRSTDGGATWSQAGLLYFTPTGIPVVGQGFRMYRSKEGRIYLIYRRSGTKLAYSDDNGHTWTGNDDTSWGETNVYKLGNNNGAYASFAELDDRLLVQSYRGYGAYLGAGKYEHAYIEKAYIHKNDPASLGNFVQVPASSSLQLNQFSIEFWLRLDDHYQNTSLARNQVILAKRDATEHLRDNCNYIFKLLDPTGADANKVEFGLRDSTHNYQSVKSDGSLEAGRWYYAAGTYDGQTMRLYLDGVLENSLDTDLTSLESSPLNMGIYSVHQDYYSNDRKFQGQIDNLKIWNTAIGADEILGNANYAYPQISSVSPSRADRRVAVAIKGINFGGQQNNSSITIGGASMPVISWADTKIRARIPSGISKGPQQIKVTVNSHQSNGYNIIVGKPPIISNLAVSNISQTRATISWKTDERADSRVYYGQSLSLGQSSCSNARTRKHQITLTGLLPKTKYYFKVSSTDSSGNTKQSSISTLATLEEEIVPYYVWWNYLAPELFILDIFDRERSKRIIIKEGKDRYVLHDSRPIFRGEAPANVKLKIVIHSKKIVAHIKADQYGKWQYQPEEELNYGQHKLKIKILEGEFKGRSKSLRFLVKKPQKETEAEIKKEIEKKEEERRQFSTINPLYYLVLAVVVAGGIILIYYWYRKK